MEILNLKGHQNRITGSRVTAILLNGWILPIGQSGEASRWRVWYQWGLPRLVFFCVSLKVLFCPFMLYPQAIISKKNYISVYLVHTKGGMGGISFQVGMSY